jgi:hypothetical protein
MMTLSILCVTVGEPWAGKYITRMFDLANRLGVELVLGLDKEAAQAAGYPCHRSVNLNSRLIQEEIMDQAVDACPDGYILRLDSDEVVSPALEKWLASGKYAEIGARVYAFPRVYMWGDERHILTNDGIWPDLQTRLGRKECMYGVNQIHAGNRHGTGQVIPYALEHHNLLVKDRPMREAIAHKYESVRAGAGTRPEYARYNLPEHFYPHLTVKEYGEGDYSA